MIFGLVGLVYGLFCSFYMRGGGVWGSGLGGWGFICICLWMGG